MNANFVYVPPPSAQEKQRSDFHHTLLRKNCVVESDGDEYLIEFLM